MSWWWMALALAVDYSAPFASDDYGYMYPTAYRDQGSRDWNCGSIYYSGHRGSDFGCGSWSGMAAGRTVTAAADGTVTYTNDGEYDECSSGACSGGSGAGNYVVIQHADGRKTYYFHLKKWSVAVSAGQSVSCGDPLGEVGSSGYSTGPHVHFEPRSSAGSSFDPFAGSCSQSTSYWISQGSYNGLPGISCTVDADGDGYDEDEDCDDSNSSVHPGASEICDDGIDNDCSGGDASTVTAYGDGDGDGFGDVAVSACGGAPAGSVSIGGDCDDGDSAIYPGSTETCDDIDNDCDAAVDEGATELGTSAPAVGAALVDMTLPGVLAPGEAGEAWFVFENVGTATWDRRAAWLVAASGSSVLHDEASWAAFDVAAVSDGPVAPGETLALVATLRAPEEGAVQETFALHVDGEAVSCPDPSVEVTVRVRPVQLPELSMPLVGGGCRHGGGALGWGWLALLLWRRR